MYYGTELSAVVHTNYTPLSENPHLEPRFPDGGWVGRFRFLCCVAVLDVVAAPVEEGGPTLPLWGRVVTSRDVIGCTSVYSLVNFFAILVGMSGAILVNHARFMRDILRDTV